MSAIAPLYESDLARTSDQFRSALEARNARVVGETVRRYEAVMADTGEALRQLTSKIEAARAAGQPVSPAWLYQETRLRTLSDTLGRQIESWASDTQATIRAGQIRAGIDGAKHAEALVAEAGKSVGLGGVFTDPPIEPVVRLIGNLQRQSPLADLFAAMPGEAGKAFEREIVRGVARGMHPNQIARNVSRVAAVPLSRAVTIARTEMIRAYRMSTLDAFQKHDDILEGWIWHAHIGPNTCAVCWSMHGTLHPLSDTLDGHPRCRCAMMPRTKGWEALGSPSGATDTRPSVTPGSVEFDRLPEGVKRGILGPGKYQAYTDGDITLGDLVGRRTSPRWGTMRHELSLGEAKAAARRRTSLAESSGRLSRAQYENMLPESQWSAEKRQAILDGLRTDDNGKILADTLDKFQDGGSISRLRKNIDRRLAGEALDPTSAARADAVIDALRHAPTEYAPKTLYRGMTAKGSEKNLLAKYQTGGDIDLNLTSFTTDRSKAKQFQYMTGGKGGTRVMVELVGDDKRLLPIQNLARDRRLFAEKEWIGGGKYEVVDAKRSPSGGILLRIRQKGTL